MSLLRTKVIGLFLTILLHAIHVFVLSVLFLLVQTTQETGEGEGKTRVLVVDRRSLVTHTRLRFTIENITERDQRTTDSF